jgi:hypothetical protein
LPSDFSLSLSLSRDVIIPVIKWLMDGDCRNISFVIHIRNGTSDSKDSRDPQKSKKDSTFRKMIILHPKNQKRRERLDICYTPRRHGKTITVFLLFGWVEIWVGGKKLGEERKSRRVSSVDIMGF